ncbi:unnamed protein product [Auanema sp. JU1783]|nr:unnamed protein product [Auanema sp. JU1783]
MLLGTLLLSFLIAWAVRSSRNAWLMQHGVGVIGLVLALIVIGPKILYSLILAIFTIGCIKTLHYKYLPITVFVGSFIYLLVLRMIHLIIDVDELASHANVIQLIMTLRAVGIAYEVADSKKAASAKKSDENVKPSRTLLVEPTSLEIFSYLYHFCGLFTGPYYTYAMFLDSQTLLLHNDVSPVNEIKTRFMRLLWSVPVFVTLNIVFPINALRDDSIYNLPFTYLLIYAAALFTTFRCRVYSAWAISESICVTLGIGIYPSCTEPATVVGPKKFNDVEELLKNKTIEFDSNAINNLDIYNVEFSEGYRDGVRSWNKSVQTWLAIYVYSRAPKAYRTELTMFVSALWHGTYAGYFMSFLVVPMCFAAEDIIFSLISVDEAGRRSQLFRWFYWVTFRSRGFDMLAAGFLLKNFADVHRFWFSLYYWLVLVALPIYIINAMLVKLGIRKRKSKQQ